MHVTALIPAGGRGQRLGGAQPKQLLLVGGRPTLERSISLLLAHPAVDGIVVALPAGMEADPPAYLRGSSKPMRLVAGGARRQDSVANAFAAASEKSDILVVHDAVRPFASADLITRTIAAAAECGAATAALPARDTVKRAAAHPSSTAAEHDEGGTLVVAETLPRASLFLAQTPQAFRRDVLRDALALGGHDATDEATLAERAGHTVRLVDGEPTNIKITTPEDLPMAEAIARAGHATLVWRTGFGYDLHRLVEGRRLILGGVTIPFERGLAGHSDADAVCHAITDAILGAAAAGDIGRHAPDTDLQWKDASSLELLRRAGEAVRERGFKVGNIDASVVAERPKLAPYVDTMRGKVANALGITVDRVSIKGKTNEGIGELGRGEAIAVHAVVLLVS